MFTIGLVRALKGAPLSIVICLCLHQQPVGEKWLQASTGYSQNTIRNGIIYLKELGVVFENNFRYSLNWDEVNIPLPLSQKMTLTTTALINNIDKKDKEAEESKNDSVRSELFNAGIREPTLSDLCDLGWVNEKYVKGICKEAKQKKISTGLLIHKIKSNDKIEVPEDMSPESYKRSWLK